VEILVRTAWPVGRWWLVARFGGLLPVALVAAVVSYRHLSGLLAHYGEDTLTAIAGPAAVDGLMVMAAALLASSHQRTPAPTVPAEPAPLAPPVVPVVAEPRPVVPLPAVQLPRAVNGGIPSGVVRWPSRHSHRCPASADFLRIAVVHNGGTTTLFTQTGAASNRNGAWASGTWNLSAYAGQSIRVLISAADASGASLVEAGIDDVRITQQ
jgi:hypothetical protein